MSLPDRRLQKACSVKVKPVCVIFTASIAPHAKALVAVGNVSREEEYADAITANVGLGRLSRIDTNYVLTENSGAPAVRLRNVCAQLGVQFIQCAPVLDGFKGKGHSEALMVDEVIKHWGAGQRTAAFLKVTGRLRVQNIEKLICKAAASDNDCLVNLHSRAKYADTRVIVSSGAFWEYVMRLVDTIDDAKHRYLEHIVPLAIHAATRAGLKCDYLLPPPMITGRSASTAQIYTASMTAHALTYLKILLKRVIYHQHRL